MKNVVIGGAVIIVLLTLALIFLEPAPKKAVVEDVAGEPEAQSPVLLQSLSPDVSLAVIESDWQVVTEAEEVSSGNKVKTSEVGRALITQDTDILTSLNSNTELLVELGLDKKTTILKLAAGQTWTKINRALEQDEVYEVHTPTLVAAVRGTSFGVNTEPSSITVTEGIVWASLVDEETGEVNQESTIEVLAGKIVIYVDGKLVIRDIEDTDKDDWYFENNRENPGSTNGSLDEKEETTEPTYTSPTFAAEPVIPTTDNQTATLTQTEPVPQKVRVTSVSPKVIDHNISGQRLTLRGDFLSVVERVVIDKRDTEFLVTSAGVLVIEGAELPKDDDVYDITLYYDAEELLLDSAFSVENSEPTLKIDSVVDGQASTNGSYLELRGIGFLAVNNVLVDGNQSEFTTLSDSLMHVFDQTLSTIKRIDVSSRDGSYTYNLP